MVQESEVEWSKRDGENEAWEWELGYITSYLCLLVSFFCPFDEEELVFYKGAIFRCHEDWKSVASRTPSSKES
jgi:hypothetical protein